MMMAGMALTIFASTKQGAILAVMLSLSGLLVLGGMLLTYLVFVREGAEVKITSFHYNGFGPRG